MLAMCRGWSAARDTAAVRGGWATTRQVRLRWNFGATGEASAPENGENVSVQGLENQRPFGFVGLRWTFEFKKNMKTGVRSQNSEARRSAAGWATWLKNMKLRNKPILKMQESPDFTDVK